MISAPDRRSDQGLAALGLMNRHVFRSRLAASLARLRLDDRQIALFAIDIDGFRALNAAIGPGGGNRVLAHIARCLEPFTSENGYLTRLGADEYALALFGVGGRGDVLAAAEQIRAAIAQPLRLAGLELTISVSVGVALAPDSAGTEEELMRAADIALLTAKAAGRGRTHLYSVEMGKAFLRRFQVAHAIDEGLVRGGFSVVYQPKVSLTNASILGLEALCRLSHPRYGAVGPDEFIPLAEETGQIADIGQIVLTEACQFASFCNAGRARPITVAINVSARQLADESFLPMLARVMHETGCSPDWIELELTESAILDDSPVAMQASADLVALGLGLTLDDFGAGYSTLGYLHRLPVRALKIDKAFVMGMDTNKRQKTLVRAIINLARELDLTTVAEGIETAEVAAMLLSLGCNVGQGYHFHRPLGPDATLSLLAGH